MKCIFTINYQFLTEVMAVPGTGGPPGIGSGGGGSGGLGGSGDGRLLVSELRHHNFDAIRFASYRTAAKLRFVQKKTNSEWRPRDILLLEDCKFTRRLEHLCFLQIWSLKLEPHKTSMLSIMMMITRDEDGHNLKLLQSTV